MDETGPMWHGKEGEDDFNMCPHVTFVPRKPEPVCAEFNDICCAISRVMLSQDASLPTSDSAGVAPSALCAAAHG